MWMLYLRVTRICGHGELVQVQEKKQAFKRITAVRVVMWGIWFPKREVCSSKPTAARKRWPSTKDRPDGKPWQRKDWPHYITMQVHINKLRTQCQRLWVSYCGSKMRLILDHIATVLDRIGILASGQIQSDFLRNRTLGTVPFRWSLHFPNVLSVSWLGYFKSLISVSCGCTDTDTCNYLYNKRYSTNYNCTIHTCMHWCAWGQPYVCTCMHDMTWILSLIVEARELSWTVPSFKLECLRWNDLKPHLNWQEIWLTLRRTATCAPYHTKKLSRKPRFGIER